MKNILFHRFLSVTFFSFILVSNYRCTKNQTDSFCKVNRTSFSSLNNQDALIGYYVKYNRWAVYIKDNIPNNIDNKMTGLICDIPSEFKVDGLNVIISGSYKKFNREENIVPQLGGEDLYYFEITKITKK